MGFKDGRGRCFWVRATARDGEGEGEAEKENEFGRYVFFVDGETEDVTRVPRYADRDAAVRAEIDVVGVGETVIGNDTKDRTK